MTRVRNDRIPLCLAARILSWICRFYFVMDSEEIRYFNPPMLKIGTTISFLKVSHL